MCITCIGLRLRTFVFCLLLVVPSGAELSLGSMSLPALGSPTWDPPSPGGLDGWGDFPKGPSGTGGIAFDKIALPDTGLSIQSLGLTYSADKPDGQRLGLEINGRTIAAPIEDWLLLPTAKFSATTSVSLFTLFGKLNDSSIADTIKNREGRILNYHPAFKNTLAGLRLFQMDILVLTADAADLPKDSGHYLLGLNEQPPNVNLNLRGLSELQRHFHAQSILLGVEQRSYVVSDFRLKPSFRIDKDSLRMNSTPFYFMWRLKADRPGYDQAKVQDSLSQGLMAVINAGKKDSLFSARTWLIDTLVVLIEEYGSKFEFYKSGTVVDIASIPTREGKRGQLDRYATDALANVYINLKAGMDFNSIDYLDSLSQRVSGRPDLIRAANPAVVAAVTTIMRYSEFFRYCKVNHPLVWQKFFGQIKDIQAVPLLETPSIMHPSADTALRNLIEVRKNASSIGGSRGAKPKSSKKNFPNGKSGIQSKLGTDSLGRLNRGRSEVLWVRSAKREDK